MNARVLSMTVMLLACGSACRAGFITNFDVSIDFSPLQGQSGFLAFDLLGGTPIESNVATVAGFSSDSTLGTIVLTGGASGSLVPGPALLDDSQFFNELLQPVAFGTTVDFTVSLTTNVAPGGIPDSFSFFLLNGGSVPFATSDPTGAGSLITIQIDQTNLTPYVFGSAFATATVTPEGSSTPEPSTCALMVIGCMALSVAILRMPGPSIRTRRTSSTADQRGW